MGKTAFPTSKNAASQKGALPAMQRLREKDSGNYLVRSENC